MMQFKDFIGMKDCPDLVDYCGRVIHAYKELEAGNLVIDRQVERPDSINLQYSGTVVFLEHHQSTMPLAQEFSSYFWRNIYSEYAKKYSILNTHGYHHSYEHKVQKTVPGEGYHSWHSENCDIDTSLRILVWSLYLNDVEEGGETEFLHQATRVSPKTGRVVIWPAGFTHVHRGNQPLSGEKYLMTGWVCYK